MFIPQIHLWQNKSHAFSDDVIFSKRKTATFQLVVLVDTIHEARNTEQAIKAAALDQLSNRLFLTSEATYIIHCEKSVHCMPEKFVFAMSQTECDEIQLSPPAIGYDKERIRNEFPYKRFLVMRLDRYTFGTAIAVDGVQDIARRATELIFGRKAAT